MTFYYNSDKSASACDCILSNSCQSYIYYVMTWSLQRTIYHYDDNYRENQGSKTKDLPVVLFTINFTLWHF